MQAQRQPQRRQAARQKQLQRPAAQPRGGVRIGALGGALGMNDLDEEGQRRQRRKQQQQQQQATAAFAATPPRPREQAVVIDELYMLARVGAYDDEASDRAHRCYGSSRSSSSSSSSRGGSGGGGGNQQRQQGQAVDGLHALLERKGAKHGQRVVKAAKRTPRGVPSKAVATGSGCVRTAAIGNTFGFANNRSAVGRPVVVIDCPE